MSAYDDTVERRARAICCPDGRCQAVGRFVRCGWKDEREKARATFTADWKAGYVLVPAKPTVKMNAALWQEGGLHGRFDTALTDAIAAGAVKEDE